MTNLISFYGQVAYLVDKGKATDVVCLVFSKAFGTVSRSIPLEKLQHVVGTGTCYMLFWVQTWMRAGPREWW